jgi:hypothetical protein
MRPSLLRNSQFLEFAALHPDRQDILILQQLAELSCRSGQQPIITVGLLHQGFHAYTDQLSQSSQREWEKVAGRFEELLFDQPLDQITHLIANALNLRPSSTPRGWVGARNPSQYVLPFEPDENSQHHFGSYSQHGHDTKMNNPTVVAVTLCEMHEPIGDVLRVNSTTLPLM